MKINLASNSPRLMNHCVAWLCAWVRICDYDYSVVLGISLGKFSCGLCLITFISLSAFLYNHVCYIIMAIQICMPTSPQLGHGAVQCYIATISLALSPYIHTIKGESTIIPLSISLSPFWLQKSVQYMQTTCIPYPLKPPFWPLHFIKDYTFLLQSQLTLAFHLSMSTFAFFLSFSHNLFSPFGSKTFSVW